MAKFWTDSEIILLKNNYNDYTNNQLSEKIGRSVSSIEKKLKSLGLKKSSRKFSMKWSDSDIRFLEDNYSNMTNKKLSEILERSPKTILNRASKMGLSKSKKHISKVSKERIVPKTEKVKEIREYKCEECGDSFDTIHGLQIHLTKIHSDVDLRNYYLDNMGNIIKCKYCGEDSKFISLYKGYSDRCDSEICLSKSMANGSEDWHMINHGNLDIMEEQLEKRLESLSIGDDKRLSDNPNYYREKSHNSKEYWKKRGYSEEESEIESGKVVEYMQSISHERRRNNPEDYLHTYTTKIEYYLNKGMTIEEAENSLTERQTTFSKEICIEKYGEVDGTKRWLDRQEKWHTNYKKSNFSKVSQRLFMGIWKLIKANFDEIYFATINNGEVDESGRNNEFRLRMNESYILPDFYIPGIRKIIEFDGTYYHRDNPENQKRERKRDLDIIKNGFEVLHISESEFNKDEEGTIQKCIDFLLENNEVKKCNMK